MFLNCKKKSESDFAKKKVNTEKYYAIFFHMNPGIE